jgi:peptidoglycan/LPS O-acetylase OafA/YrhL
VKVNRIDELESLRGLMSLWVIVNHVIPVAGFQTEHWPFPFRLLGEGTDAVEVFVILSGFVIFNLIDTAREPFRVFVARRFLRIFPVYFVCLIASIVTMDIAVDALQRFSWPHPLNAARLKIFEDSAAFFWPHVVAHVTMLHGMIPAEVLPSSAYAFIGQAWSVSLEWQFYLVAPLLFLVCDGKRYALRVLLLLATLIACLRWSANPAFLPGKGVFFFLGIGSFFVWKMRAVCSVWIKDICCPALAFTAVTYLSTKSVSTAIWVMVFASILSIRSNNCGQIEGLIVKGLNLPIATFLGRISYSMYLTHMLVLYLTLSVVGGALAGVSQIVLCLVLLALVIPTTIVVSWGTFLLIEKPFIRIGRQFARSACGNAGS